MENKTVAGIKELIDQIFRVIEQLNKEKTQFIIVAITEIKNGKYYGKIKGQNYELPISFAKC